MRRAKCSKSRKQQTIRVVTMKHTRAMSHICLPSPTFLVPLFWHPQYLVSYSMCILNWTSGWTETNILFIFASDVCCSPKPSRKCWNAGSSSPISFFSPCKIQCTDLLSLDIRSLSQCFPKCPHGRTQEH